MRTGAAIRGIDLAGTVAGKRAAGLDRHCLLALLAGREAWADAAPHPEPTRAGAVMAATIGVDTYDAAAVALYAENARRLPPLTVPRVMPSAPASALSIEFGLRGASFAVASACASGTHAIGLAAGMIRAGMLDVALAGGSDASLSFGLLKAWEALRVLSPDTCRPFARDRSGLVLGEGAAVLVLEDYARARARGATIHAEIMGFGMSADAADLLAPDRDGALRAMQGALDDAGLPPDRVDHVNAHGTGTRLNDATEAAALHDLLGPRAARVPVSAIKSQIGHCLNAAGAIEAVATVLALRDGFVPPTIGFTEPDPDCRLDCVPNEARRVRTSLALSNSFAFGGLNAALAIGRVAA